MSAALLVTGASGNVGRPLVDLLVAGGVRPRVAHRRPDLSSATDRDPVRLDFLDPDTWGPAFAGAETMFLVRPPELGDVRRGMVPALEAARQHGVRHVVLLSVQGAGRVPVLPHAALERWLRSSGLSWTFLRPSYFMSNLTTVLAPDIRERDQITVPSGHGRTAFVDVDDVAAVAAEVMLEPAPHAGLVWTPTGPAMRFDEVASVLSAELGRPIVYTDPSIAAFARHAHRVLEMPWPMVAVTTVLHAAARLGVAGFTTDDVAQVLGRPPTSLATFAHRERDTWLT